jgi:RNA polymerase sigma factor (sigma-70 family)
MKDARFNEYPVIDFDGIVYVIDDDVRMHDAVTALLHSAGLDVRTFSRAHDFFSDKRPDVAACVILDVRLQGQSGFSVREQMMAQCIHIPVIFMTAYADVAMSVRAMRSGASHFLEKPFRDQDMLDAVVEALAQDKKRRCKERSIANVQRCFETLTPRERRVMELVAAGLLNKQIAAEMALSEMTVKIHRSRAMRKMESRSVADFVLKANALREASHGSQR